MQEKCRSTHAQYWKTGNICQVGTYVTTWKLPSVPARHSRKLQRVFHAFFIFSKEQLVFLLPSGGRCATCREFSYHKILLTSVFSTLLPVSHKPKRACGRGHLRTAVCRETNFCSGRTSLFPRPAMYEVH